MSDICNTPGSSVDIKGFCIDLTASLINEGTILLSIPSPSPFPKLGIGKSSFHFSNVLDSKFLFHSLRIIAPLTPHDSRNVPFLSLGSFPGSNFSRNNTNSI